MRGFAGFFSFPDPPSNAGRFDLTGSGTVRSDDGRLTAVFDGTIHNRPALRAELAAAGQPAPPDDDDAALFLALYARFGAACVERLRGPFALAAWDGEQGLLACDPMGLRALYYSHDERARTLAFATGVRPLAASGLVPRQLDARGLYGFFRHGAVPGPVSMVAGVRALETGGRLLWRAGKSALARSRTPAPVPYPPNDHEMTKALRTTLLDSVDQHLADHPAAGVFVGGGIGSAALLALARDAGREKNLRALTIGFDDAAMDETDLARRTAAHFGVPHTHLRLDRARARAWFDDYLPALDQPDTHGFPMFALCRFAREEGVTVALAGIGLGEFFGDLDLHKRANRLFARSQRGDFARALAGWARRAGLPFLPPVMQADFLSRPPSWPGAYAALRGVHTAEESRAMVARFTDPTGCADLAPEEMPSAPDEAINALEYRRRLRDQLLRQAEGFGRAHGLEVRLPFADQRVKSTIDWIPAGRRALLKRVILEAAVPELPPWITVRNASGGLRFPLEQWQAEEWGASKPADAIGRGRTRRTWEQKWSLFLFRRWWRQVGTGEAASVPRGPGGSP